MTKDIIKPEEIQKKIKIIHHYDEFASIPSDIYEIVIQGFTTVSTDPLGNTKEIKEKYKKWDNIISESESTIQDVQQECLHSNDTIINIKNE